MEPENIISDRDMSIVLADELMLTLAQDRKAGGGGHMTMVTKMETLRKTRSSPPGFLEATLEDRRSRFIPEAGTQQPSASTQQLQQSQEPPDWTGPPQGRTWEPSVDRLVHVVVAVSSKLFSIIEVGHDVVCFLQTKVQL